MNVDDIALTLQHGLGFKGVAHLLALMGGAEAVYAATEKELIETAGIKRELAHDIINKTTHRQAEKEIRYISRNAISAAASTDEDYPCYLRECADYPHVLYFKGNEAALNGRLVSVVGTRSSTAYGSRMCDRLIGRLAEIEPDAVIVSGLAYGIDGEAHRAAMRYGLRTVAVVPNPLPDVVPSQHRALAEEIIAKGGAVVTELHSQTKQNGAFYVPRNRIIAGMSEGTVVVESPCEGGAISTADYAYGYERVVMAVPGRVDDKYSAGANVLVRKRIAAMVCSGDDIVHELGWNINTPGIIPQRERDVPVLKDDERRIVACFGAGETLDMDTLLLRSGVPVGELAALLLDLEVNGVLRLLPGRKYESTGLC